MRALGLSDTIFYNMRDGFITAVTVVDGPLDAAAFIGQMEGVIAAAPGWRERAVRLGVWSFALAPRPIDLADHVFIVRDPAATTNADVAAKLDRLRRARFRARGPAWRIFLLNPAGTAPAPGGAEPRSAVFLQTRHGLLDAVRVLQAMSTMAGYEITPHHRATAARLAERDFDDLPRNMTIQDSGMFVRDIPRAAVTLKGDPATRLAEIAATIVEDATLFPDVQPLAGNYGRTRLVRRRGAADGAAGGTGNHVKMETVPRHPDAAAKRGPRIPGLEKAQNLPIMQYLVAIAPGPLARLMMRIWYGNFDAIGTLVPVPGRLGLGGRGVDAMYGVPPLWGPVPLMLNVLVDRKAWHLSAFAGRGFGGNGAALLDRIEAELTAGSDDAGDAGDGA